MKKNTFFINTIKFSTLLCLMYQSNLTMAAAIAICTGKDKATGITSAGITPVGMATIPTQGCAEGSYGVALYESFQTPFTNDRASIGVGMDNSDVVKGAVYIYAPNGTTINSTLSMDNHKITGVTAGTDGADAVNLNQLNNVLDQSKAYTDTTKAEAQAYTDKAKTEAITTSNTYTDASKQKQFQ